MERLAEYVSALSSPPLMAIVGIALGAQSISASSAWLWAFIFTLLSVLPPILYVVWLLRSGRITNFHLDVRSQRKGPLLIIVFNTFLVWMVLYIGGAPTLMLEIATAGLVLTCLVLMVTLRWKISGHCAAVAGLASLNWMLFGQETILIAFIVPVVAWSRIQLGRHTISQAVSGAVLGGVIFALTLYLGGDGG
jgi:membrane-associated phospholipid phosphatase